MGCAILTLVCLWSCFMTVTPLTEKEVHKATLYIQKKFKLNDNKQFAYVAVFPEKECKTFSGKKDVNILKNENAADIANALNNEEIYVGSQMVLATYKTRDVNTPYNIHSEHRLMFPTAGSQSSPVDNLLNKNKDAKCALFYTLNSPCVGVCANTEDDNNIIQKLSAFTKFGTEKAFIYNMLYVSDIGSIKGDPKERIWKGLNDINTNMNVYRCFTNECYYCFLKESNKFKNKYHCLI